MFAYILFICLFACYLLMPYILTEYCKDFFIMGCYQRKWLYGNIIGFEKSDKVYEKIDKKTKEKNSYILYHPIVSYSLYDTNRIDKSGLVTVSFIRDFYGIDIDENLDKIELDSSIPVRFSFRLNGERITSAPRKWDENINERYKKYEEKRLNGIKKYFLKYHFSDEFVSRIDLDSYKLMEESFSMSYVLLFIFSSASVFLLWFFIQIMYPIAELIFPYISFLF